MSENHVTYRGSMKDTNIIQLPAEWKGKVDLETISVSLTPIATCLLYTSDAADDMHV